MWLRNQQLSLKIRSQMVVDDDTLSLATQQYMVHLIKTSLTAKVNTAYQVGFIESSLHQFRLVRCGIFAASIWNERFNLLMFTLLCAISIQILKFFCKDRRLSLYMSRTLHLFGTDWGAMMVPIQVIRWYRMQCYDGTDSCAIVVSIRRYCQQRHVWN